MLLVRFTGAISRLARSYCRVPHDWYRVLSERAPCLSPETVLRLM